MQTLKRGILIALEGIDGSGKTLLAKNLFNELTSQHYCALLTKEPGGTPLGIALRKILQEKTVLVDAKAEFLLFAADRAQHFNEIILPALKQKKIILSDRMADSSLVYQGYGRGLDKEMIKTVNHWAMNNTEPDLVLYVKIDPQTARERLIKRGKLSAFDQEPLDFFNKLVHGFETTFNTRKNVITLDGRQTPENLVLIALESILSWLKAQKLIN
jgi:dTMP kinase